MKKQGFTEPQVFNASKHTTFSSTVTTTNSTGASSNTMASKEISTGPDEPLSRSNVMPSSSNPKATNEIATSSEATGIDVQTSITDDADWSSPPVNERKAPPCGSCTQVLDLMRLMSGQLASLSSEVSRLNLIVEQLSQNRFQTKAGEM